MQESASAPSKKPEDETYGAIETHIARELGKLSAARHTLPLAPDGSVQKEPQPLLVEDVLMPGAPRSFAQPDKDRIDFDIILKKGSDLRALMEGDIRKDVNTVLKASFDKVKLQDGTTLSSHYNLTGEKPEVEKPMAEQLADVKKLVEQGIAQAGDAIPKNVADLLTHAKTFADKDGENSVFGFNSSAPLIVEGVVTVNLGINEKGATGEKSNAALVQENITNRKDEILAAIKEAAIKTHASSGANAEDMAKFTADLTKLDLKAAITGDSLQLTLGNTPEQAAQGDKKPDLVATELSKLSGKNLEHIINDTLLFTGKDAGNVAHLIADSDDIRRILTQYKEKAPAFAEALKHPVIEEHNWFGEQTAEQKAANEKKPIFADVSTNTSLSTDTKELNNVIHVGVPLPKGVSHTYVVNELASAILLEQGTNFAEQAKNKPVVGSKTEELMKSRAAAANSPEFNQQRTAS